MSLPKAKKLYFISANLDGLGSIKGIFPSVAAFERALGRKTSRDFTNKSEYTGGHSLSSALARAFPGRFFRDPSGRNSRNPGRHIEELGLGRIHTPLKLWTDEEAVEAVRAFDPNDVIFTAGTSAHYEQGVKGV